MRHQPHAFNLRSAIIAAGVICALLGWTSSCVAEGVHLPVRTGAGVALVHSDHAPGEPDTCCQQMSRLSAPAHKVILTWNRLLPFADWSAGPAVDLALVRGGHDIFSFVSPGTSPPPYILRAWPNAPPAA